MKQRFYFIDGIRGLAALGVVLFHLYGNLKHEMDNVLPIFVKTIFSYGYLGVPVFFVISGFVISYSVGDSKVDRKFAIYFMLKRLVRISPAYWASILFSIVLLFLQNFLLNKSDPFPSVFVYLAHIFYLQDILSIKPILSVAYWTLCLEIQLYIFYLITCWVSQKISLLFHLTTSHFQNLINCGVGLYSIALDFSFISINTPGLFISNWHFFLMGILLNQVYRGILGSHLVFYTWLFIEIISQISIELRSYSLASIILCLMLVVNSRFSILAKIFNCRVLQYLGMISYTLYLVHPEIGWKVISLCKQIFNDNLSCSFAVVMIFISGIFFSLFFAHLFHIFIEKPSLRLNSVLQWYYQ